MYQIDCPYRIVSSISYTIVGIWIWKEIVVQRQKEGALATSSFDQSGAQVNMEIPGLPSSPFQDADLYGVLPSCSIVHDAMHVHGYKNT